MLTKGFQASSHGAQSSARDSRRVPGKKEGVSTMGGVMKVLSAGHQTKEGREGS